MANFLDRGIQQESNEGRYVAGLLLESALGRGEIVEY